MIHCRKRSCQNGAHCVPTNCEKFEPALKLIEKERTLSVARWADYVTDWKVRVDSSNRWYRVRCIDNICYFHYNGEIYESRLFFVGSPATFQRRT